MTVYMWNIFFCIYYYLFVFLHEKEINTNTPDLSAINATRIHLFTGKIAGYVATGCD